MSTSVTRAALLADLDPADRPPERILCLGHAIKEIMTPRLARTAMELGVRLGGARLTESLCISDGGDGFLEVCQQALGLTTIEMVVTGPLGRMVVVPVAVDLERGVGAIEMARVCGLSMVPASQRDIFHASSGGLGEVIARMVTRGVQEIHIGLGGSASCDGGAGLLIRLEEGLTGTSSRFPHYSTANLAERQWPDLISVKGRLAATGVRLFVYADVQTPLLGPNGTARFFSPQKGATPDEVEILESIMAQWADEVRRQLGSDPRDLPGAGAAGGVGFALAALGATPGDGASRVFKLIGLDRRLAESDAVLTCEGRFDRSSITGKAPWKAALAAREAGRGAIILCGVADPAAVAEANSKRIRIVEFGRNIPEARRSAESFTRLSETVRLVLRGLA
ncbi:glycerate kinase [bacterium]|nr:glycerate kinase [bacterium]